MKKRAKQQMAAWYRDRQRTAKRHSADNKRQRSESVQESLKRLIGYGPRSVGKRAR